MEESRLKKIVRRTILRYNLVNENDKIAVAVSGGKDSVLALHFLLEFAKEKNATILPFYLDVGCPFFPDRGEIIERIGEELGLDIRIFSLKDLYGKTLLDIKLKRRRKICGACGVIKRYLMNKLARDVLKAKKLATGHNMDDFLFFFFRNLANKKFEWMKTFSPIAKSFHPKVVTRIRPLFFLGNDETEFLANSLSLPHVKEKRADPISETIMSFLPLFDKAEKELRRRMVKGIMELIKHVKEEKREIKLCKVCGEITSQEICSFCKLLKLKRKSLQ